MRLPVTLSFDLPRATEHKSDNVFVNRLSALALLSPIDVTTITRLTSRVRSFKAHADLARDDDPSAVLVVLSGFACCYRQQAGGKRQNLAYLLPGDMFDRKRRGLDNVGALSPCRIAFIPRAAFQDTVERYPQIGSAVDTANRVEEAISREWLLNLGSRSAAERIAHLFCELLARLRAVDLVSGESYTFPVSQSELSATVGLSPVHVNRTLQDLRRAGLIELKGRTLQIKDTARLRAMAGFTSDYLLPSQPEDRSSRLGSLQGLTFNHL